MPGTRLAKFLILLSATALVVGLCFPVAAISYDPYLGYGVVFISIPSWTLGAIAGAAAAYVAPARSATAPGIRPWAGALGLLNVAAIALVLVVPFYAS